MTRSVGSLAVFRALTRDGRLRRLGGGYQLFALAEYGTWLAITIWAFERGGVAEVGLAAFVQLLPAGIVAPLAAYAGDRFRRDRVLLAGFVIVAATCGATGAAILLDAPGPVVYLFGAFAASAMTVVRPAIFVILPVVTEDARSLSAAHAGVELIDNFATFAGPAIAGLMLTRWSAGTVFVVFGVAVFVGSLAVLSLRLEGSRTRPTGDLADQRVLHEMRAGWRSITSDRSVAVTMAMLAAAFIVMGALDVMFVAVALDLLERGDQLAGFLSSSTGAGGLAGAAASILLVGRARLRSPMAVAALLGGPPLIAIALAPGPAVALLAMAAAGSGLALLSVAGRTLVQRTTTDDVLARVFGILESASQLGLAVGSLVAGVVANAFGVRAALTAIALILPLTLVAAWRGLRRADERAVVADPAVVDLIRRLDLFQPLPAPTIEQLAINMRPMRADAGDEIIRAGAHADRFYVVESGQIEVSEPDGRVVATLGPGDFFGEIALIRSVPRTASVRAVTDSTLRALGRSVFLEAVTGHPIALSETERIADQRHKPDPDPDPEAE